MVTFLHENYICIRIIICIFFWIFVFVCVPPTKVCKQYDDFLHENDLLYLYLIIFVQGVFFNWFPPKKLKYVKPRLGESTLT